MMPGWFVWSIVAALTAHLLASFFTNLTIGAMGSITEFARAVRERDLAMLFWYRPIAFGGALWAATFYARPILTYFRDPSRSPPEVVRRRVLNGPAVIAGLSFVPWLIGTALAVLLTWIRYGYWSVELMSQHVWSPLVNSFLAVTTTYLLLERIFRKSVIPRVFRESEILAVSGSIAPGVSMRLFITLLAVAFIPLFTMLGLVRAAAVRFAAGLPLAAVVPELARASEITFAVFVALGVALAVVFAKSLTTRLAMVAAALRRVQAGDLDVRVEISSGDEVGILEGGVNAMVAALREKERIFGTFGRVVEPAVRDHLLSGDVRLGGELRHATILFCDLRGFTAFSERTPPAEVVSTLNEFFTNITAWVRGCGGFVDKFIGDSLLVVFGLLGTDRGPAEGAAAALRCAIGIEERLAELNAARAREGKAPLAVTMGLHSGEVLAGTIGAHDRHEFTVIGDTVNVAARLQEACKERDCELLVSEATCELARAAGFDGELSAWEPVLLRGRREAVRIRGRAAAASVRASSA